MRTLASFAGLLGGLAWLGALVLERTERGALAEAAEWLGLLLLLAATVAAGAGLVSRSVTWLRVVVGVCLAVLVWSLVQLAAEGAEDRLVHAVVGLLAVVVASAIMARRPEPGASAPRRSRGAHAR